MDEESKKDREISVAKKALLAEIASMKSTVAKGVASFQTIAKAEVVKQLQLDNIMGSKQREKALSDTLNDIEDALKTALQTREHSKRKGVPEDKADRPI